MGLDFGSALQNMFNQMQSGAHYNDELRQKEIENAARARQIEIAQQQADFSSPREMSITPNQIESLAAPFDLILRNTAVEAGQLRPDVPIFDTRTNKVVALPANGPAARAFDSSIGSQPRPLNRGPQSGIDEGEHIVGDSVTNLADDLAKKMGLRKDEATGVYRGPGRQVQEYYDMLGRLLQAQASIYSSYGRPIQTQLIQDHTSGARAKDPHAQVIASAKAGLAALQQKYGKIGSMMGADSMSPEDQALYNQYQKIIQDETQRQIGVATPAAKAPQAPQSTTSQKQVITPKGYIEMTQDQVNKGLKNGTIVTANGGKVYVEKATHKVIRVK